VKVGDVPAFAGSKELQTDIGVGVVPLDMKVYWIRVECSRASVNKDAIGLASVMFPGYTGVAICSDPAPELVRDAVRVIRIRKVLPGANTLLESDRVASSGATRTGRARGTS
jgi:hypothetical protein